MEKYHIYEEIGKGKFSQVTENFFAGIMSYVMLFHVLSCCTITDIQGTREEEHRVCCHQARGQEYDGQGGE